MVLIYDAYILCLIFMYILACTFWVTLLLILQSLEYFEF